MKLRYDLDPLDDEDLRLLALRRVDLATAPQRDIERVVRIGRAQRWLNSLTLTVLYVDGHWGLATVVVWKNLDRRFLLFETTRVIDRYNDWMRSTLTHDEFQQGIAASFRKMP